MMFKVAIALAAYYFGKSGLSVHEFLLLLERLLTLDEGK